MTITHDWGIRGVDRDTSSNRVLRLHWTLDSYDGDVTANSYGTLNLSTVTVLPISSVNLQASINLLFQELGMKKTTLENTHGKFIAKKLGDTEAHVELVSGTATNASIQDTIDYTNVTDVVATLATPNKIFNVKVTTKTAAHPKFGTGSEKGYTIDGVEGDTLTLLPGQTYRFNQFDATNQGHPLRFYKKASKIGSYQTNVTAFGTPGIHGAFTQITIPLSDPLTPIYYQCSVHPYMGGQINVTIASSEGGGSSGY